MVPAQRAPVRPRVFANTGSGALLLEDEVARFLETGVCGLIAILGPAGSGKTTALQHLAAVFPPAATFVLLDDADFAEVSVAAPVRLVVYTGQVACPEAHRARYRLAPWGKDEWIEYLLAMHRPRCAAVMARLHDDGPNHLGGVPELWRVVLDRLAEDDAIRDARRALHCHLQTRLGDLLPRAQDACLKAAVAGSNDLVQMFSGPGNTEILIPILRHRAAQQLLAVDAMVAELTGTGSCDFLATRLPRDLVRAAGFRLVNETAAVRRLHGLLAGPIHAHAMSASLLHAAGTGWAPTPKATLFLVGAYLDGACWPGVDLEGANLAQVDLSAADLTQAKLTLANLRAANLTDACLRKATFAGVIATDADLRHADLSESLATEARFDGANLEEANFNEAVLRSASFGGAKLSGATFRGADLCGAQFSSKPGSAGAVAVEYTLAEFGSAKTQMDGADFTDANLTEAVLSGLCLRTATWTSACFHKARLNRCDLEYLSLPGADFTEARLHGALLTGTTMPAAHFQHADLRETGLADVEWEDADLRDADLRKSTFHMGSSRSGRVGSPIASEGSRMGFYTDDYEEQSFKAPEEIRKANLCRADLRGARIDGVDFYLVDLRGAIYDSEQEQHFRRCGAILATRE